MRLRRPLPQEMEYRVELFGKCVLPHAAHTPTQLS
jgi:hypothetical protein